MHLLKRNIRWDGARYIRQSRASGMKRLRKLATHPSIFNPAKDWINVFLVYATKLFLFGELFGDTLYLIERGRRGCSSELLQLAQRCQIVFLLLLRVYIIMMINLTTRRNLDPQIFLGIRSKGSGSSIFSLSGRTLLPDVTLFDPSEHMRVITFAQHYNILDVIQRYFYSS